MTPMHRGEGAPWTRLGVRAALIPGLGLLAWTVMTAATWAIAEVEVSAARLRLDARGDTGVLVRCREVAGLRGREVTIEVGRVASAVERATRDQVGASTRDWSLANERDISACPLIIDWGVRVGWCPQWVESVVEGSDRAVVAIGEIADDGGDRLVAKMTQRGVVWKRTFSELRMAGTKMAYFGADLEGHWLAIDGKCVCVLLRDGHVLGAQLKDGRCTELDCDQVIARRPGRVGGVPKYMDAIARRHGTDAARRAAQAFAGGSSLRAVAEVCLEYADSGGSDSWNWVSAWSRARKTAAGATTDDWVRNLAECLVENRLRPGACEGAIDSVDEAGATRLCGALIRAGGRGERLVRAWMVDERAPSHRRKAAATAIQDVEAKRRP